MENIILGLFNTSTCSPCKDCPERKIGCHSICDKYISFKEQLKKNNNACKKVKNEEDRFNSYEIGLRLRRNRRI